MEKVHFVQSSNLIVSHLADLAAALVTATYRSRKLFAWIQWIWSHKSFLKVDGLRKKLSDEMFPFRFMHKQCYFLVRWRKYFFVQSSNSNFIGIGGSMPNCGLQWQQPWLDTHEKTISTYISRKLFVLCRWTTLNYYTLLLQMSLSD